MCVEDVALSPELYGVIDRSDTAFHEIKHFIKHKKRFSLYAR